MKANTQAGGSSRLTRYFVEHREVGWMALVGVLIWGWFAYHRLAQQEDPRIPERRAVLVTRFPGAGAAKIEDLVTRKLEEKLNELECIDELKSESRLGVSIITISQRPAAQSVVDQEWDKLRAKLREVVLPEGCDTPALDTDFGNTVTLLFGITSPPTSRAEGIARANLIRTSLAALRRGTGNRGRAAVFAFYPAALDERYRQTIERKFVGALAASHLGEDIKIAGSGWSYSLADFKTTASEQDLHRFINGFTRELAGSDGELHPDFPGAVLLMGEADPLEALLQTASPRYSYRELERAAESLEDDLKQVASVGRVRKIGNVPEVVQLLFSVPNLDGFRITPDQVINAIATRNAIIPGGIFRAEGQGFPVQLSGEFRSETDLLDAIVGMTHEGPDAMPIYLRDLFEVRRGYDNPISFNVQVLARPQPHEPLLNLRAVLVAVEMKEGNIIGRFNQDVQAVAQQLQSRLPDGMEIATLSDQPKAVTQRIHQFIKCFLEAVIVVVLVALFLMDARSALVVALAIPLTVSMTLGGMHLFHVPLHQISIAALIIALGMLVDDPVVASDGVNRELAAGQPRTVAAWLGPFKLRRPILFGTLINILAFLPLVLLPGDKGAFIWALPVVVTLSLVSSRIVSMTFVPLLAYHLLRGQKGFEAGGEIRSFPLFAPVDRALVALLPRYQRLLVSALNRPLRAVAVAYTLLALSFLLIPLFGRQFFPAAERNQLLIDIELGESASPVQTRQVCRQVEGVLKSHDTIASAAVFAGGTAPRFYYNVAPREPASHLAQVLINTYRAEDVPPLLVQLRAELDRRIVGARCVVKQLEQGPPVEAPIQVRISGKDADDLRELADHVADALRGAGAYKVHDDLGRRVPTLQIDIDQQRANSLGIGNNQVGRLARAAFTGLKVTELREGDHLIPVLIRLRAEERNEAEKLRTLYVSSLRDKLIPLDSFASINLKPEYPSLAHFNKLRTVTVKAYAPFGELPDRVLKRAQPAIQTLPLRPGYRIEFAGEEKELRQSQSEMGQVMKISLGLIALVMVIQFNSVSKSVVVMLTAPLGLIGAFLGLAITHSALGFMALLGMVSLAGVIISHIIVLSDFIEEARSEGMEIKKALLQAGLVRLRAVLVTVLATVGGLVPLTLTGGALWRPLTSVHIFGLLLATLLTLVLLPVLYYLFQRRTDLNRRAPVASDQLH